VKILIVSHYFYPHIGGIENVVQNQAQQLSMGHNEVMVLTSAVGAKKGLQPATHNYSVFRLSANNLLEDKFSIPFPLFYPSILWKTYRFVKASDIVHVHDSLYISSFVAVLWAKLLRKPIFMAQHVAIIPHPSRLVVFTQSVVYKIVGSFIIKNSQKIFVINNNVKDFLISRGIAGSKVVVYKNGVDLSIFRPATKEQSIYIRKKYNLPENDTLVLFVGRFVPKKGFDKLLQAGSDDYTIVFVGGERPSKQKPDKHFIFLGMLSKNEIAEIYRACDIFILPSIGEGFPLSIQEAMASGLPIITTDDDGYSMYDFDRTKLLLIEPSVQNIQQNIHQLVHDPELRKAMGQYSVFYASRYFNWGTSTKTIIDSYHEAFI